MKDAKKFPSQQENGQQDHHHRHQFSERQSPAVGFEAPSSQAENIQCGKSENDRPQNVVHIVPGVDVSSQHHRACDQRRLRPPQVRQRECNPHEPREQSGNTEPHSRSVRRISHPLDITLLAGS